jgi:hypothetical protein
MSKQDAPAATGPSPRFYVYIRVSRTPTLPALSVADQMIRLRAAAASRGHKVVAVYIEQGDECQGAV